MTTCGVCGAENAPGATRCGACGQPLIKAPTGRSGTLLNVPSPVKSSGSPPPPDVTPIVPIAEAAPPTPRTLEEYSEGQDLPTQIADPSSYDEHPAEEYVKAPGGTGYTTPVADSSHHGAIEPPAVGGGHTIADPSSHDGYIPDPGPVGGVAGYPPQQAQTGYPNMPGPAANGYPSPPSPHPPGAHPRSPLPGPMPAAGPSGTPVGGMLGAGPSGTPAGGVPAAGPSGTPATGLTAPGPIPLGASSPGLPVPGAPPPLPARHGTGNQPAVPAHVAEPTPTLSDSITPAHGMTMSNSPEEATPPHGAQLSALGQSPPTHELFPAGGQVPVPPGMLAGQGQTQAQAQGMAGDPRQAQAGAPAPHLAGSYAGGSVPVPQVPNTFPNHRLLAAAGGRIMAVHPTTGRVMWWSQLAHVGHTIYELQIHGELLFALVSSGLMFCMDHATGRTRWTATISPGTNATLQVTDAAVYVTHGEQLDCINMHGWRLWSMALQGVGVQNAKIVFA